MNDCERLDRSTLAKLQLERLHATLGPVLAHNAFYRHKLNATGVERAADIRSLEDFSHLPLTPRAELSVDQVEHPPYGTNLTYPAERYTRIHQTTGTTGQRLRWLDTAQSWAWMTEAWAEVLRGAGVGLIVALNCFPSEWIKISKD